MNLVLRLNVSLGKFYSLIYKESLFFLSLTVLKICLGLSLINVEADRLEWLWNWGFLVCICEKQKAETELSPERLQTAKPERTPVVWRIHLLSHSTVKQALMDWRNGESSAVSHSAQMWSILQSRGERVPLFSCMLIIWAVSETNDIETNDFQSQSVEKLLVQ